MALRGMILAAGFGKRLGSLTEEVPKPLLPVNGVPMISSAIYALKNAGCSEIIINAHHHIDKMLQHFINYDYGVKISISIENEILGTGGGIIHARKFLENESFFLLHNADIVTDTDLRHLVEEHRRYSPLATLLVQQKETTRPVLFDDTMRFLGKQAWHAEGKIYPDNAIPLNYCGVMVLSASFFGLPLPNGFFDLFDCLRIALDSDALIKGLLTRKYWTDLGTAERIRDHERRMAKDD